jgi:hypothetical protein
MPTLTKTAAERIAACASVGLHYWADSPLTNTVWASGDDRRYHLVQIDRTLGRAHHVCGRRYELPGMYVSTCPGSTVSGVWPSVADPTDRTLETVDDLAFDLRFASDLAHRRVG